MSGELGGSGTTLLVKRPRAQRKSQAIRRREILSAAASILMESGSAGLTVDQVALQVGIGKTTVYLYYPKREALIEAAIRAVGEDCLAGAAQAIDGVAGVVAVRSYCRHLFEAAQRLPVELVAGIGLDRSRGDQAFDGIVACEFVGAMIETVTALIEQGHPAVGSPSVAARTLVAAVMTQAQWARSGRFESVLGQEHTVVIDETLSSIGVAA